MAIATMKAYLCERCGYRWAPRKTVVTDKVENQPKMCPACKSPFWNKERKLKLAPEDQAASRV